MNVARLAGVLWLLNAIATYFSLGYVRPRLIISGDAAATAANIVSNDFLFRSALVGNLFAHIFLFFLGLTLYRLFEGTSKALATVLLTSIATSVAIAIANLLNSLGALTALSQADYLKAFTAEQLSALAMLFLRLSNFGQGLLEFFWAPFYFAFGLLIIRSAYLPRILGILLVLMSVGFPVNTVTKLLIPQFFPATFTQLAMGLAVLGGVPTMVWLLVKGVREPQATDHRRSSTT